MIKWLYSLIILVLLVSGCSKEDPVFILSGQSLQASPAQASIHLGSTQQYLAILVDENGDKTDVTSDATWSSSNLATATIDAAGLASSVAAGSTTITAEFNGTKSTAVLEVNEKTVTAISVFPGERNSIVGLTTQYTATVILSDNTVQDVTADAAWSSNEPTIASIDTDGKATATGVGDATITASYAGANGTAMLHVLGAAPTSFVVKPATASVKAETQQQYSAIVGLSTGDFIDVSREVVWATSNSSVATASNDPGTEGIVLGVGDGTASVLAVITNDKINLVADAEIIVNEAAATSLQITPTDVSVPVGAYGNFQAIAGFDDGNYRDVTLESSWTSSNVDVGVIITTGPNAGLALAVGQGNTAISANFDGVSATEDAAVTAPTLIRLEIVPGSATTIEGLTVAFEAYGFYSDRSLRNVTTIADWSTDDAEIAVMDPRQPGVAHAVAQGSVAIVAQLDGISDSSKLGVDGRTITHLAVFPAISQSIAGLTTQYNATAVFNDKSIQDVTADVDWSSDDLAIADIDANGLAMATGAGDATITASISGVSSTAVLHVLGALPVSFKVQPSMATIPTGTQQQFTATVELSSGEIIDATGGVFWLTGDATVATVSNDSDSAGLALGTGSGATSVLASVQVGNSNLVASAEINVTGPTVTSVQITPKNITVPVGARGEMQAVAYFSDASSRDVTSESTWSSSDPTVGVVVPDGTKAGTALAVSEGSVVITAAFNSVPDSASIEVSGQSLVRLDVHPKIETTPVGLSVSYSATGVYSDFSAQDVTQVVSWSTSDSATAVMSSEEPGVAQGISPGMVEITAELEGKTDAANLTVTAATATEIVIRQRNVSIYNGGSVDYRADVTMSDGTVFETDQTNTVWASGDTNIATFTRNRADAVAVGETTVTVTYMDPDGSGPPLKDSTRLVVTDAVVTDLNVEPVNASISTGYEQAFKAIARYSDDSSHDVTRYATWRSSNTGVATINTDGVAHGEAAGIARITASFDGLEESANLRVSAAVLERLIVIPEDITMIAGVRRSFNAIAEYSDRIEEVTDFALWETSNEAVATVSNAQGNKGVVTARSAGPAMITAFFDGLTSSTDVTVTAPNLVLIEVDCGDDVNIDVDASGSCKAIGKYDNGDVSDITETVDWVSSDTAIVTVWKDVSIPEARIYGVSVGTAEVSATEGLVNGFQTIAVNEVTLTSISVLSPNDMMLVNDTEPFFAFGTYSDGNTRFITQQVTWLSSNENVLQISDGLATAIGEGSANVSAVLDTVTGSKAMAVLPNTPDIDEFTMFCNKDEIKVNKKAKCEAYATTDGESENVTALANWATDDPGIAVVDGIAGNSGKMDIVGVSKGTTNIRAEYEGFTAAIELVVR